MCTSAPVVVEQHPGSQRCVQWSSHKLKRLVDQVVDFVDSAGQQIKRWLLWLVFDQKVWLSVGTGQPIIIRFPVLEISFWSAERIAF